MSLRDYMRMSSNFLILVMTILFSFIGDSNQKNPLKIPGIGSFFHQENMHAYASSSSKQWIA